MQLRKIVAFLLAQTFPDLQKYHGFHECAGARASLEGLARQAARACHEGPAFREGQACHEGQACRDAHAFREAHACREGLAYPAYAFREAQAFRADLASREGDMACHVSQPGAVLLDLSLTVEEEDPEFYLAHATESSLGHQDPVSRRAASRWA